MDMFDFDKPYLVKVKEDGEMKLLYYDGYIDGKDIDGKDMVDLSQEGSFDLVIPEGVTYVDISVNLPCNITSVYVPKSVKKIVNLHGLFNAVQKIEVDENNPVYYSRGSNAIIEKSTHKLILGCVNTIIPEDVVVIGECAFYGTEISKIDLPKGLQKIGDYAFSECTKLQSFTIPASVSEIGDGVFMLSNITKISVDENNQKYDSRNDCNAIIEKATNTLIYGCGKTKIPKDVTKIGDSAFCGCKDLKGIKLPKSVTSIGPGCFSGSSLKSIDIPDTVTKIGHTAFMDCRALKKITIPVAKIGYNAFLMCDKLSKVYFSKNVKYLDMREFTGERIINGEAIKPFRQLQELRFSASIKKIENLHYYFREIDTLVFEGQIPETDGSFKRCKIRKLIIKLPREFAREIPDDIREALVMGNVIYP